MLATGMSLGLSCLEIPFRYSGGIAYAEKTRLSSLDTPITKVLIGFIDPDEAINTAILAAWDDQLLVPRSVGRVPDLDIAVCSTNC